MKVQSDPGASTRISQLEAEKAALRGELSNLQDTLKVQIETGDMENMKESLDVVSPDYLLGRYPAA
jgi:hypothetical protein